MDISVVEMIVNMPSYVEFLKKIMHKKKKLEAFTRVPLTKNCSIVLQNYLPIKMKDPGSFIGP